MISEDRRDDMRILVLDRVGALHAKLSREASLMSRDVSVVRISRPSAAIDTAAALRGSVIVAAPDETTHAGLQRLAAIHRADPAMVVMLAVNGRNIPPAEVAACGVTEVVSWPVSNQRLRGALQRALQTADQRRRLPAAVSPARDGKVFTVTSATGGCGKTFYATNLASYLASATGERVLLVDLDLQFGEVAVSLQLRPLRTIAELVSTDDPAANLADFVVGHRAGFDVLCAPKDPFAAELVGPRETSIVIEAARHIYDYVVVDTPPALNEVVLSAFDQSAKLIVLATLDIPSLKNMKVFLQTVDRLKLPASDIRLVLNKEEPGIGIELKQVQRMYEFDCVLPYAREVTRSINAGSPVINSDPSATVAQRFIEGAKSFAAPIPGRELPWAKAMNGPKRWWQFWKKGGGKK